VPGEPQNNVSSELHYAPAEQLRLPAGPVGNDGFSASLYNSAGVYGLVRDFQDFDGDGRSDFVSLNTSGTNPVLAINRPSSLGDDSSMLLSPVNLPNSPAAPYSIGAPDQVYLSVVATIDNTYQQVIDFNGDGRPDIVIATEGRNPSGDRDPNYWMVLINTQGRAASLPISSGSSGRSRFPLCVLKFSSTSRCRLWEATIKTRSLYRWHERIKSASSTATLVSKAASSRNGSFWTSMAMDFRTSYLIVLA
jgi:hypothetical protein